MKLDKKKRRKKTRKIMYALDFDKERRKKSYTGRHSHTNLFEYDCKIPILDDDNNDAHHFHGMPYRKQLFENI